MAGMKDQQDRVGGTGTVSDPPKLKVVGKGTVADGESTKTASDQTQTAKPEDKDRGAGA